MKPGILVILDGFGVDSRVEHNAVRQAKTPNLDRLYQEYPSTQLMASEEAVGLPTGFMGNSEVGHLNLGAGRVVYQDFSLISRAIEDRSFFNNPALTAVMEAVKRQKNGTLHLMGLVSDGGVHSHISHLFALIEMAKELNLSRVEIHAFTDGRDTSPSSGLEFVSRLEAFLKDTGVGQLATVMGRFYAMDRDKRWERIEKAYRAIVEANGVSKELVRGIRESYEGQVFDEFIEPILRKGYRGIKDGDGVIFFNFRSDRARELTEAMTAIEFPPFSRRALPVLSGFVTLTPYDARFSLPTAFEKEVLADTLGEIVSREGLKQLRIAETEKYAHVTYFFNGGEEKPFEGERRVLIPSPREVKTYDLKPQMSAETVTDELLRELEDGDYTLTVVNFANPDMVGHTGNLSAAIQAVETIDRCLGRILKKVEEKGYFLCLTADHGNCETMQDDQGCPMTAHTLNPVPFILADPRFRGKGLRSGGKLSDVAPTVLELMGLRAPAAMTGRSLL